ncbi:MAG: hypothetical protein ACE5K7_01230 [Phycisphaerae bacterium]
MSTALLAQLGRPDRLEAIRRGIGHRAGDQPWTTLLVAAGAAVGLILSLLLISRLLQYRRKATNSPQRLFRQAMAALDLPTEQRQLLRRTARKAGLSQPAVMLLSPRLLALAMARSLEGGSAGPELQQRFDQICRHLFDRPLPELHPQPTDPPARSPTPAQSDRSVRRQAHRRRLRPGRSCSPGRPTVGPGQADIRSKAPRPDSRRIDSRPWPDSLRRP